MLIDNGPYVRKTVDKVLLVEAAKHLEELAMHYEQGNSEFSSDTQIEFSGIAYGIRKGAQEMLELVGKEYPSRGYSTARAITASAGPDCAYRTEAREPLCR